MPKLVSIRPTQLIVILKDKGFVFDRIRGSHHIFYNPITGTRATVAVHGKDVKKGTLNAIIKESGLDRALFVK
jgi:predicted RNA binding protein YcfA (HicA-like mRNA interferase family)